MAAAAGINKQGALATMDTCARHGRGAHGSTVKVSPLSTRFIYTLLSDAYFRGSRRDTVLVAAALASVLCAK